MASFVCREDASCNFVATERSETAFPVDVGPRRRQPGQPGRAIKTDLYLGGEYGGDSGAPTGGDRTSAKTTECRTFAGRCFRYGKEGQRVANCMVKLCG